MKKYPDELEPFVRSKIPIRNRFARQELIDEINEKFGLSFTSPKFRDYCYSRGIKVTSARRRLFPGDEVIKTSGLVYVVQEDRSVKSKAQIIYESVYGPIQKNERVIFLDMDRSNFTLDNLFVVTETELGHLGRSRMLTTNPEQTMLNIQYYRLRKSLKDKAKDMGLLTSRGYFKFEEQERQLRYSKEKKRENGRRYREKLKSENPEKYKAWIKQCNEYKKKKELQIEN